MQDTSLASGAAAHERSQPAFWPGLAARNEIPRVRLSCRVDDHLVATARDVRELVAGDPELSGRKCRPRAVIDRAEATVLGRFGCDLRPSTGTPAYCQIHDMVGFVVAVIALIALLGSGGIARRYRHDLQLSQHRLATLDRASFESEIGTLEFAEAGSGDPLLVSHGIFHGFDGGLLSVEDLTPAKRVIAPSRFGYLGSVLPPGATGAVQADAFAIVLDHLGLDVVDIIAISAGTGPAIQFALRHPNRIEHLVISSGNFPGSPTAQAPPGWAKTFYSDRAMWALKTFARPMFASLMGIPTGFPTNEDEARVIEQMLGSIFPIGPRVEGAIHDAWVSNPEVGDYPLEDVRVPTMIIHAKDDPLASYSAAAAAAKRIPDAVLVTLESGGHLQLGQSGRVRTEVLSFLAGLPTVE